MYLCCFVAQPIPLILFHIRKSEEGAYALYVVELLGGARDLFFLLGLDGLVSLSSLPYLSLQSADVFFSLLLELLFPTPSKLYLRVDLRHPCPGAPVEVSELDTGGSERPSSYTNRAVPRKIRG